MKVDPYEHTVRGSSATFYNSGSSAHKFADGLGIHLEDDRFRIVTFYYGIQRGARNAQESYTYIEHNCRLKDGWKEAKRWTGHTYASKNRGMERALCGEAPAPGLQAAFWFMKDGPEPKVPVGVLP